MVAQNLKKSNVYSIQDIKAEFFGPPMVFVNDAVAIRALQQLFGRSDQPYNQFPEDYRVFKVGHWLEETGELLPEQPQLLITGQALVGSEEG